MRQKIKLYINLNIRALFCPNSLKINENTFSYYVPFLCPLKYEYLFEMLIYKGENEVEWE